MSTRNPNIDRLLKALDFKKDYEVPYFEYNIMRRSIEYVLGKSVDAEYNFMMDIKDQVELLKKLGIDAIVPFLIWSGTTKGYKFTPEGRYEYLGMRFDIDPYTVSGALSYEESFIRDWEDLPKLSFPFTNIKESVKRFVEKYIEATKGTGIGVAPTNRSVLQNTYLVMGITNFSKKIYTDRDLVEHIMDIFMDYSVQVSDVISELDVDFFILDDDMADSHGAIIPPKLIEELWVPRTEEILKPLKRKGIPITFHTDGCIRDIIPIALDLGIKAIHPVQPGANDIYEIKKRWDDKICLMGNIDIAGVLAFGTPREVEEDVKEHIDRLAYNSGYVVMSSHSIINTIPPENFVAMVKATQKYGVYK